MRTDAPCKPRVEGKSFADADDPFEGMEPHEIEVFLKKQAPDGDPYAA